MGCYSCQATLSKSGPGNTWPIGGGEFAIFDENGKLLGFEYSSCCEFCPPDTRVCVGCDEDLRCHMEKLLNEALRHQDFLRQDDGTVTLLSCKS